MAPPRSPFERHVTPNGSECYYRHEPGHRLDHTYWRHIDFKGGRWVGVGRLSPSVSAAAKTFDLGSSDGLLNWSARLNNLGIAALAADCLDWDEPEGVVDALTWLGSGPAIDEALERAELTWRHVRDAAATRGTAVHRHALQAKAEGRDFDLEQLSPEERGFALGVAEFWDEWKPEPVLSETVVADLEMGVAGRLDLVAAMPQGPYLFDLKTVSTVVPRKKDRPFYSIPNQVQLAGYDYLLGASGYPRTVDQFSVYVDGDGDFEVVKSHAHHGDFKLAVAVHRSAGEIRAARSAGRTVPDQLGLLP